jgi:hypothetical protein
MKKSKWMIIGAMALAFGFVLAGCEHRATPPSEEEVAAMEIAEQLNIGTSGTATVKGTTVTLEKDFTFPSTTSFPPLPAGVTIVVKDNVTLKLDGVLTGDNGAKLVIEGSVDSSSAGATNFYDEDGNNITNLSEIKGTYVWEKITIKGN